MSVALAIAAALLAAGTPRVDDPRIVESSGLAPGLRTPDVLWTHNDSGNPPLLFALDGNGGTAGTLRVRGVPNVDWEALASLRSGGTAWLAVGDIGDNAVSRDRVEIDLVPEPARPGDPAAVPVSCRLLLRYPDGPADAEVLLADPRSGRLYLVTKTLLGARLYAVPASAWPGAEGGPVIVQATLEAVAEVPTALATDGAFLPDGRIVLRNYSAVEVFPGLDGVRDGRLEPLVRLPAPAQPQGESLAVVDGGRAVLLGSEGSGQPLLRLELPPAATPIASPSPRPSATPSVSPTPSVPAERDGVPVGLLLGAGALLTVAVIVARGRRR